MDDDELEFSPLRQLGPFPVILGKISKRPPFQIEEEVMTDNKDLEAITMISADEIKKSHDDPRGFMKDIVEKKTEKKKETMEEAALSWAKETYDRGAQLSSFDLIAFAHSELSRVREWVEKNAEAESIIWKYGNNKAIYYNELLNFLDEMVGEK